MKQDLDKKSALREGFCFARAAVPMAAVMLLAVNVGEFRFAHFSSNKSWGRRLYA